MANENYKEIIVSILNSLKTPDNENIINKLLIRVAELPIEKINSIVNEIGATKENIYTYLQEKIDKELTHQDSLHKPINELFTYGITGSCVHLHMPINLNTLKQKGLNAKMDLVNLYLLDALKRIQESPEFEEIKEIYMISPILIKRELDFLEKLGFSTLIYDKKDLQNSEFISKNPESQLAIKIFGNTQNIGRAKIGLDKINSKDWQYEAEKLSKRLKEKLNTFSQDR